MKIKRWDSKRRAIWLEESLEAWARQEAKRRGQSFSAFLTSLIDADVRRAESHENETDFSA